MTEQEHQGGIGGPVVFEADTRKTEDPSVSTGLLAILESVAKNGAAQLKVQKVEGIVEPIQFDYPDLRRYKETFRKAVGCRASRFNTYRREEYSRFQRICAWLAELSGTSENVSFFGAMLTMTVIAAAATAVTVLFQAETYVPGWVPVVCALPLAAHLAARWLTRDRDKVVYAPFFRAFLARREKEFDRLEQDIKAFNAWAQSAEIPEDLAEAVVAHAELRRTELLERAKACLADVDRVIQHREKLKRFKEARKDVDAAFPDPTGRMTMDIAPRMAVLRIGDALLEEAIELGLPTDEIVAARGLSG